MKYVNIREETLKNRVAQDFFGKFDCTEIIRDIDFAVKVPNKGACPFVENEYLLWAEAKRDSEEIFSMLTQLVLTIGKARTFDKTLPPPFLGCFDCEKIAFVSYADIQDIFYQNDFNWKVAPSDAKTREFKQVYAQIEKIVSDIPWETYIFDFEKDEKDLKRFIRDNFVAGKTETTKIRIDKNNFIIIYNKWLEAVKPTIQVDDWTLAKKNGITDGDFYLADLLSAENKTLKEKLSVLLKTNLYELNVKVPNFNSTLFERIGFSDNQKAHTQFWAKYERPPLEEYWGYITDRRDLLVPQDVRERKGSFYTPKKWVELSQKYLADVFGEDWQDEYYIWDCAAGTGNLLAGLTNKYNIWASTIDKTDVDVMKDRIQNGAILLENHVFQFDFLNDDFTKLPKSLQEIIKDPKLRKKLIIYINPPYAEASSYGKHSIPQVANVTKIFNKYKNIVGAEALSELFAQFFIRIYQEIPDAYLASFSKLKFITSEKFLKFRKCFRSTFEKGFICQSDTFDNVSGKFPIGFLIWNLAKKQDIKQIQTEIFLNDKEQENVWHDGTKNFYAIHTQSISDWRTAIYCSEGTPIGYIIVVGPSIQSNNNTFITNYPAESYIKKKMVASITNNNLIEMSIYHAVRKVITADWINDRDLYLFPNSGWQTDDEFQNNCLAYTLFNNNISSKYGTNHWIPFMESEVKAGEKFESHFMMSFISGKIIQNRYSDLFEKQEDKILTKREFSSEAKAVFEAGKKLWQYYHAQPKCNINASLYDIREHFQERNDKGKMNNKSDDETYNELIGSLRSELKKLARKIEPKVYDYGFLRK